MKVGVIKTLWRFPVKSFQGESLQQAVFEQQGLLGDREYALIDNETGKVVSAKSVRLFPDLLMCSATYTKPPQPGQEIPPVEITLADGTRVTSDSENVNQVLSEFFKRKVTLARSAPQHYTIDQYHPDLDGIDPAGHRDTTTEQKLGSALFKSMGVDSPIPEGSFMDVFPASVITTSTLEHLQELRPEMNFDLRRFRMNVVIKTDQHGFVENSWIGKTIQLGNQVSITITMPDPRCVMTTLAQPGIPKDNHVLQTLVAHNKLDIMGAGKYPCAGVYGVINASGSGSVQDPVELN
jgi:uncharacterized protein YcbX